MAQNLHALDKSYVLCRDINAASVPNFSIGLFLEKRLLVDLPVKVKGPSVARMLPERRRMYRRPLHGRPQRHTSRQPELFLQCRQRPAQRLELPPWIFSPTAFPKL